MITLHHAPQSRSMRVLWLLHELRAQFEVVERPFDKSLRSQEYLALSPAGRVPALEIDGMRMFESGAMVEYLCERFPEGGLGRAPGDAERADWLIWVHFSETISQHIAALTQQHIVLYEDHMRSPIVMRLEAVRLQKCYAAIEERLALSGEFLLPSGFSAADICVGQALYMARRFARTDEHPMLRGWYGRITAREGFRKSLPGPDAGLIYQKEFYEVPDG